MCLCHQACKSVFHNDLEQRLHLDVEFFYHHSLPIQTHVNTTLPELPTWANKWMAVEWPHQDSRADSRVLVSHEVCIDGVNYTATNSGTFEDVLPEDIGFPFSWCKLNLKQSPGWYVEIPCPRKAVHYASLQSKNSSSTGCIALAQVTKDKSSCAERNQILAQGIRLKDVSEIRFVSKLIADIGYQTFSDEDYLQRNLTSALEGNLYRTFAGGKYACYQNV